MTQDEVINGMSDKMEKSIAVFQKELASMRAGRATPQLLERIMVDYYGAATPISQMANISVPEARVLLITLWDQSAMGAVEKAIQKSDLGINPSNDGKSIRLVLPELTQERRQDLVKQTRKMAEECKVAIRAVRRDALETIKKMQKASDITEDDLKDAQDDIQKATDAKIKQVDVVSTDKEKELMAV